MAGKEHAHPNYMAIFWWLAILTVVEIAVVFMPFGKLTIGVLLCGLALAKAALVAMYVMHLRFEARTMGFIALTPVLIGTLLVLVLLPDGFSMAKKSELKGAAAVTAPAKN